MAEAIEVVMTASPDVQATLRRKTGTEDAPVDTRLRVAPDAKEWFAFGECNGPKVTLTETGVVKWVRRVPAGSSQGYFLTDDEMDALKEESLAGTLFSDGSVVPSPTFLDTFRGGCRSAMILPVFEMDGEVKAMQCVRCGAKARWHSAKPMGAA